MSEDLLVGAIALLRSATTYDDLRAVSLAAARRIAGSDGATFVVREDELCFYVDEDAISALWKGQRFPLDDCISGWVMRHGVATVSPDITTDPRIPQDAYLPTFVRSLAMIPMGSVDPLGAIGVYWAERGRTVGHDTLDQLTGLAAEAGRGIQRLGLAAAPWAPNFALNPTAEAAG